VSGLQKVLVAGSAKRGMVSRGMLGVSQEVFGYRYRFRLGLRFGFRVKPSMACLMYHIRRKLVANEGEYRLCFANFVTLACNQAV
jgi:hypothetical protein